MFCYKNLILQDFFLLREKEETVEIRPILCVCVCARVSVSQLISIFIKINIYNIPIRRVNIKNKKEGKRQEKKWPKSYCPQRHKSTCHKLFGDGSGGVDSRTRTYDQIFGFDYKEYKLVDTDFNTSFCLVLQYIFWNIVGDY